MYVRVRDVRPNNEVKSDTDSTQSEAAHRMRSPFAPERRLVCRPFVQIVTVSHVKLHSTPSCPRLQSLASVKCGPSRLQLYGYESCLRRREAVSRAAKRRTFV